MDLVLDQVDQLEDVHVADGDLLVEGLAGAAVVERDAAVVAREILLGNALVLEVLLGLGGPS